MTAQIDVDKDPLYDRRQDMLDRVRATVEGSKPRAEALHQAFAAVGVAVGWHETEVVAEVLRHRYDDVLDARHWLVARQWRDPHFMAAVRRDLRRDLVMSADALGMALVEEPAEWLYAAPYGHERTLPDDDRGRTPLTAAQVAAMPDNYFVLIKLVGHVQKLTADA